MCITKEQAIDAGYTKAVFIEGGMEAGDFLIKPDTDLDSSFYAYSLDWEPAYYKVNGATCLIEPL